MAIRNKDERRALHTTPQKKIRKDNDMKQSGSKVTKNAGNIVQEINIDGEKLYHELTTHPTGSLSASNAALINSLLNIKAVGGSGAGSGAASGGTGTGGGVASHDELTGVSADDHHPQLHTRGSHSDWGTPTGSGEIVLQTSPSLITPVLGTPSSGNLASCTTYPGDVNLVTTGALNSGSITSGFGTINIGADNLTATGTVSLGAASFNDNNITNVGDIALDTISSDAGTSISIVLGTDAGDDLNVGGGKLVVEGDTGRVGIGVAAPNNLLEISSVGDPSIRQTRGTSYWQTGMKNTNEYVFSSYNGSTSNESMRIERAGNVGINTTSPDRKLEVKDSTNPQLRLTRTEDTTYVDFEAGSIVSGDLYINPFHETEHTINVRVEDNIPPRYGTTIKTSGAQSQVKGWSIDYLGGMDMRYIYTDELHAKAFIADLEQALAGGQIIAKSVATLAEDFLLPSGDEATNGSSLPHLNVNDLPSAHGMRVFAENDWIRIRQFARGTTNFEDSTQMTLDHLDAGATLLDLTSDTPAVQYRGQWALGKTVTTGETIDDPKDFPAAVWDAGAETDITSPSAVLTTLDPTEVTCFAVYYEDELATSHATNIEALGVAAIMKLTFTGSAHSTEHKASPYYYQVREVPKLSSDLDDDASNKVYQIPVKLLPGFSNDDDGDIAAAGGDSTYFATLDLGDGSSGELLIGDAWGRVEFVSQDEDNNTQKWKFSRPSDATGAGHAKGTVNADAIVIDYGTAGNGYYEVNAVDGYNAVNSPYSQTVTWEQGTVGPNNAQGNLQAAWGMRDGVNSSSAAFAFGSGIDTYYSDSNPYTFSLAVVESGTNLTDTVAYSDADVSIVSGQRYEIRFSAFGVVASPIGCMVKIAVTGSSTDFSTIHAQSPKIFVELEEWNEYSYSFTAGVTDASSRVAFLMGGLGDGTTIYVGGMFVYSDNGPGVSNALTVNSRMGQLKGITSRGEFGLFAGDGSATTDRYLVLSDLSAELHNLPLRLFKGTSETIRLDPSLTAEDPYIGIGTDVIDGSWDSGNKGFLAKSDATYGAELFVGDEGGDYISWTAGTLTVKGTVHVTGGDDLGPTSGYPYLNLGWKCDNIDYWGVQESSGCTISVVTLTDGKVGQKAIRCSDDGDGANEIWSLEWIPCSPENRYRASLWARQPSGDKLNYLAVAFRDSSGGNIASSPPPDPAPSPGWDTTGTYWYWNVYNSAFPTSWTKYNIDFGSNSSEAGIPSEAVEMRIGILIARPGSTATVVEFQDYKVIETTMIDGLQEGVTITSGGVYMAGGGKLTIGASNSISYGDAEAIFIGETSGNNRLSLKGGASDGYLTWDGSVLSIKGSILMTNQSSLVISGFNNDAGFTNDDTANSKTTASEVNSASKTGGSVGGWTLNAGALYSGTEVASGNFTSNGGITIGSDGHISTEEFRIDTDGNAYFKGTLTVGGTDLTTSNTLNSNTTSSDVGLGNVDNQSASTIQAGTTAANVGLGNVPNYSAETMRSGTTSTHVGLGNVSNISTATMRAGVTLVDIGVSHVSDTTKIDGGNIYTGTVTADYVSASLMSAIHGDFASVSTSNILLDGQIFLTGTGNNLSIGQNNSVNGIANVNLGKYAGQSITSTPSGGGKYNVNVGYAAGGDITYGDQNVCIGMYAGNIGAGDITNGSKNIIIGYGARTAGSGDTEEIVIGDSILGKGSDTVNIGGSDILEFWLGSSALNYEGAKLMGQNATHFQTANVEITSKVPADTGTGQGETADATLSFWNGAQTSQGNRTPRDAFTGMGTQEWKIANDSNQASSTTDYWTSLDCGSYAAMNIHNMLYCYRNAATSGSGWTWPTKPTFQFFGNDAIMFPSSEIYIGMPEENDEAPHGPHPTAYWKTRDLHITYGKMSNDADTAPKGRICWSSSSSKIFKENIVDADVSWLYDLRPVDFNFKRDESKTVQCGLIAEEVWSVKREMCHTVTNKEKELYPDLETPAIGVDYKQLISPLLKAIQELSAKIDSLETRVTNLE